MQRSLYFVLKIKTEYVKKLSGFMNQSYLLLLNNFYNYSFKINKFNAIQQIILKFYYGNDYS